MRSVWSLTPLTLLLLLLIRVPVGECGRPPSPVEVVAIQAQALRPQITLIGDVEAFTEGDVHTEVQGLVESFPVKEGDFVKTGQLIAKLNSSQLILELENKREDWERARVLYEKEEKEHDRFKTLSRSKSVSTHELDKEWSEAESAKFRKRMLEATIRRLEDLVSKNTISAPFDGYVIREHMHVGMWVGKGGEIVRLVKVDPIYVRVPFPQRDLSKLQAGDTVDVRVEAVGEELLKGKIASVIARGDTSSRTFPVKVTLANTEHVLKPGMLAYVTFRLGKPRTALVAPKDAVVTTPDQKKLLFHVVDGKATPIPIRTGQTSGSLIEVKGKGLKEGLRVVIVGNERLRPGQSVRIVGSVEQEHKVSSSPPEKNSLIAHLKK